MKNVSGLYLYVYFSNETYNRLARSTCLISNRPGWFDDG